MKTDELIRLLAADLNSEARQPSSGSVAKALGFATAASSLIVGTLIVKLLSTSPYLADGPRPTMVFTAAAALALAVAAFAAAAASSRPGVGVNLRDLLALPALVMLIGLASELARFPAASWPSRMMGSNPLACFALLSLLAIPILGAVLIALRSGAPSNPRMTGAVAGLLAGAITAALYVLHCPEDSLLFIVVWHTPAVLLVSAFGAIVGERLLRW
jgi:hypothetical protein